LPRRLYWDSCAFIGLLNPDEAKHNDCRAVWEQAERGEAILFTSFFTFSEVFRAKCEGLAKPLAEEQDKDVEALLRQPWVQPILVDERIGVAARRLMRRHPECKKPSDGIHLATALALSVDEMHTYDRSDLIGLSEKVSRADGIPLRICTAYVAAPPLPLPIPSKGTHPHQGLLPLEAANETITPSDHESESEDNAEGAQDENHAADAKIADRSLQGDGPPTGMRRGQGAVRGEAEADREGEAE
jgi:predicted nucleic acid-binding protein